VIHLSPSTPRTTARSTVVSTVLQLGLAGPRIDSCNKPWPTHSQLLTAFGLCGAQIVTLFIFSRWNVDTRPHLCSCRFGFCRQDLRACPMPSIQTFATPSSFASVLRHKRTRTPGLCGWKRWEQHRRPVLRPLYIDIAQETAAAAVLDVPRSSTVTGWSRRNGL